MSNDEITFSCSSCGVELKVPSTFAGVTGPCPGCQASITAPFPSKSPDTPTPSPHEKTDTSSEQTTPSQPSPPTPSATEVTATASSPTPQAEPPSTSSPAEVEPAPANKTFPSSPSEVAARQENKTSIPPKRGEVELPRSLAADSSSAFPSTLIPLTESSTQNTRGQDQAPAPESSVPAFQAPPQTSPPRGVTPPPPPSNDPPVTETASAPLAPPQVSAPSIPQPEPQPGQSSYTIPQPVAAGPPPTQTPVPQPSQAPRPTAAPPAPVAAPPVPGGLSTFTATPPAGSAPEQAAPAKRKLNILRLVIPVLFIVLCVIAVYLVTDVLRTVAGDRSKDLTDEIARQEIPNSAARSQARENGNILNSTAAQNGFSKLPTRLDSVSADVPSVDPATLYVEGEAPPSTRLRDSLDAPLELEEDHAKPSEVLSLFLTATSLEERKKFLSRSKRSQAELAASSLAKPLPEVIHSRLLHYMINEEERHTEHFFEVSFEKVKGERPALILVQVNDWGDGQCKVHTDAFLDLFEDSLSAYAAKPVDETRTFHVIADAYKHCFDEIIPGWDKKSFLKLRNHPRMSPKLIAYFDRNSQLANEISQPEALPWG